MRRHALSRSSASASIPVGVDRKRRALSLSDLASGVTAEITYVDGGFSHVVGGIAEPVA